MDEIYTCLCGEQFWSIHAGFIKCRHCGKECKIEMIAFLDPSRFNDIMALEKGLKKKTSQKKEEKNG